MPIAQLITAGMAINFRPTSRTVTAEKLAASLIDHVETRVIAALIIKSLR
jgi:hypothetical protein